MYGTVTSAASGANGSLEELVGDTILGVAAALGMIHFSAALIVLLTTRGTRLVRRTTLVAASLLIPVLGPVVAVIVSWNGIRGRSA